MKQQRRMKTVLSSFLGRGKHRQNLEGGQNQLLTLFARKFGSMVRRVAGNLSHKRSDMLPQSPVPVLLSASPPPTLPLSYWLAVSLVLGQAASCNGRRPCSAAPSSPLLLRPAPRRKPLLPPPLPSLAECVLLLLGESVNAIPGHAPSRGLHEDYRLLVFGRPRVLYRD
jgi:hypothetical protein